MTKLVACGIIIAAGWFCGIAYSDYRQKGYNQLCGLINLIEAMRNAISYSRTELYGIFSSFSDKSLDECGFLQVLKSTDTIPAGEIWNTALECLSLEGNIKSVLSSLGDSLGLLDCDSQLEKLDGCLEFLTKERDKLRESLEKKLKSYRWLGFLAGCLVAIVLY
ncbi:MAG: stage III sporulation protein AB [Eubacteriales bacterium]|jgi:stage III sporulation protein AB